MDTRSLLIKMKLFIVIFTIILSNILFVICSSSTSIINQDLILKHNENKQFISNQIKNKGSKEIVIKRKISQSHCPRPHDYKNDKIQIDLSTFNKVLSIKSDSSGNVFVDCEAMISFEDLVDYLLPYGYIPAVVPEFKGITVGGSLQGLAAESTSFKYGYVHDAISSYEVIIGNGDVITCSEYINSDLYHSLPGSFGSLGICTKATIKCLPCKQFVKVVSKVHNTSEDCISHMTSIQDDIINNKIKSSIEFIEGISYDKDKYISIIGEFIDSNDNSFKDFQLLRCNVFGSRWFFNQIKGLFNSKDKEAVVVYPIKDYLFRHDRGSFWMASYRIPQIIGRFMGKLLDSSSMFKLATALPWAFPKSVIVLQDFMLPRSNVNKFVKDVNSLLYLFPLWLLPIRNFYNKQSIFSISNDPTEHVVNVGLYGIPNMKDYSFIKINMILEEILTKYNGRKVFYSHAFYSKSLFYNQLYDGKKYFSLRKKYHAIDVFPEIYDKIITKDGKL